MIYDDDDDDDDDDIFIYIYIGMFESWVRKAIVTGTRGFAVMFVRSST